VQQEATEEFMEREIHQSLFIVMGGVTPAKGDFVVGERDQSVVGDSHAMSDGRDNGAHALGLRRVVLHGPPNLFVGRPDLNRRNISPR
jgi:hypothetical protein